MKTKKVNLSIPADMHESLNTIATHSGWTLEQVMIQTLKNGMPPSVKKIPTVLHGTMLSLNKLNDNELWDVLSGRTESPKPPNEDFNPDDFITMWRAYAFALLKWRGHPMPDPAEFIA